jgi:hypothetical protein
MADGLQEPEGDQAAIGARSVRSVLDDHGNAAVVHPVAQLSVK